MMRSKIGLLLLPPLLAICLTPPAVLSQEKQPSSDTIIINQTSAVISIPEEDQFYLGKEKIRQDEISHRIKELFKDRPPDKQIVYIKASWFVKYGTVVSVIDALRESSFDRIGLVTEKEKGSTPRPGPEKEPSTKRRGNDSRAQSQLEQNRNVQLPIPPDLLLVEIRPGRNPKQQVMLNSKSMSLAQLAVVLERTLEQRDDKTVYIKAARAMPYGEVIKVIDAVKGAGAQPIGLKVDYLQ